MPHLVSRLTGLAVGVASLALAACASVAVPPGDSGLSFRSIHVTGTRTRQIAALAVLVQGQLQRQLGARYVPGARGGASLDVVLTDAVLPVGGGRTIRDVGEGPDNDQLEGRVAVTGPGGRPITSFPLLSSSLAINNSEYYQFEDSQRLQSVARAFAYYTIQKLG